jgi:hypothetical protein
MRVSRLDSESETGTILCPPRSFASSELGDRPEIWELWLRHPPTLHESGDLDTHTPLGPTCEGVGGARTPTPS